MPQAAAGGYPIVAIHRLQRLFGISRKCAKVIIRRQEEKRDNEEDEILSVLQLLKKWNLNVENVTRFPQVLKGTTMSLDHHKHILEECGIKVGVSSLAGYLRLNRAFLFALESHGAIPPDHDIVQTLCDSVEMTSADDIRHSLGNVSSRPLMDVRLAVFRRFLCQRLDCDEQTARVMVERYPRNRHKSLRLTAGILCQLEQQNFSAEKIIRNPYLLNTHPEQLEALLKNCPTVASTDIREMIHRVPRIAYMPWHNTVQIIRCLNEHGFSEKMVMNGAELFSLSADTVRQRLALMSEIPELWAMRHNKNFLSMVFSFQRTLGRLNYMQSINMRCVSVHMLSTFYPNFRRHVSTGEDNSGGVDMVTYLSKRLAAPRGSIRHQLRLHPFWRSVPLASVSRSTEALLEAGFSAEQVRHALQLCLYPCSRVLAAVRAAADAGSVPEPHVLQLALYLLERDSHFSGTGVFEFAAVQRGVGGELPDGPEDMADLD
ncbi:transcription termination factor 5, mitochondrial-like [Pollicipes pollicipes]|uniref:transcription termination factor 5, mitochondrial-like n=1 Tax=Pollicipes pollicipes TaxID=41117 RepID=UPI001884E738|nr:transcription termination factor 5, mitochondrial-like [Pollicipes pollicipes]XP_037076256.1 transcription termination factor 5, mitochondrial-like [Pollicipes pollicipes]